MSTSRLLVGGTVLSLAICGLAVVNHSPATPPLARSPRLPSTTALLPLVVSPTSVPLPSVSATPSAQSFRISTCHGSPAPANFRQIPNFSPGSILGVVTIGQSVQIAPHPVQAEGLVWYQVVNLAPLAPSTEATAQNQIQAGQVGWIAGCFVRGSPGAAVPNPRSSLSILISSHPR